MNTSFRSGILCVVSGPSGCGKTTLCRATMAVEPVYYTVSCTTRTIRPGEQHGRDYFFLDEQEFRRRVAVGEFLEHAVVHGHRYGTLKSEVLPRLAAGQDVIMDLDVQGAAQLRTVADPRIARSLVDVFILLESMDALRTRLAGRQSETSEHLALRLTNAAEEMNHWKHYQYAMTSRSREEDLMTFRTILAAERHRTIRLSGTPHGYGND